MLMFRVLKARVLYLAISSPITARARADEHLVKVPSRLEQKPLSWWLIDRPPKQPARLVMTLFV